MNDFFRYPESLKRAKELGEKYYFTNKKCKNGHVCLRFASSGNCVQCIRDKRGVVGSNYRNNKPMRSEENQKLALEAHDLGFTTYESKTPCPKGHTVRFTTNNNCVECSNIQNRNRKDRARWSRILKIYGLSKDEYFYLLKKQDNKCAICGDDILKINHIDHDHKTNKVRGILCSRCNQAMGLFREDKKIFLSAINYLEEYSEKP